VQNYFKSVKMFLQKPELALKGINGVVFALTNMSGRCSFVRYSMFLSYSHIISFVT